MQFVSQRLPHITALTLLDIQVAGFFYKSENRGNRIRHVTKHDAEMVFHKR